MGSGLWLACPENIWFLRVKAPAREVGGVDTSKSKRSLDHTYVTGLNQGKMQGLGTKQASATCQIASSCRGGQTFLKLVDFGRGSSWLNSRYQGLALLQLEPNSIIYGSYGFASTSRLDATFRETAGADVTMNPPPCKRRRLLTAGTSNHNEADMKAKEMPRTSAAATIL